MTWNRQYDLNGYFRLPWKWVCNPQPVRFHQSDWHFEAFRDLESKIGLSGNCQGNSTGPHESQRRHFYLDASHWLGDRRDTLRGNQWTFTASASEWRACTTWFNWSEDWEFIHGKSVVGSKVYIEVELVLWWGQLWLVSICLASPPLVSLLYWSPSYTGLSPLLVSNSGYLP